MPGADDCAIAFRQGMLDVLKLDTLPPEWEPMVKERVVQAIAEDPELAHDIMYADPDVTKARNLAGNPDSPQAVIFLASITDVMMGF